VAIVVSLLGPAIGFFQHVPLTEFFGSTQWFPSQEFFGVLPLVMGTLNIVLWSMVFAIPIGLGAAIYLSEYAPRRVRKLIKPVLEVLAGIPTVVYGYFALLFVTPALQRAIPSMSGFNALSPGIVMGVMILPLMSSLSEDALRAVPRDLREAALALGATRFQTTMRIVVPAAFSGLSASAVLAVSRAIGETMIVAIAAGQQPRVTANPLVPVETMTAYIVQVTLGDAPAGTLEYRTIFAVGMLLFVSTFTLNIVSSWLRGRFRREYA
jgi:phosphate transport system permease protein